MAFRREKEGETFKNIGWEAKRGKALTLDMPCPVKNGLAEKELLKKEKT